MEFVTPEVFHLAATATDDTDGMTKYLDSIGAENWDTDAPSDAEALIEIAGRTCYKSFNLDLNPNLSKIREGNQLYLDNILRSHHGAVIEHASDTYALCNVSRVLTHELVRHRLASYSQESLRFVRLTELKAYFPQVFKNHAKKDQLRAKFKEAFEYAEKLQQELTDLLELDTLKDFKVKKELTSAMRRCAPDGLATTIIITANHRTWRHLVELRTSPHAEEEIREVFYLIGGDLKMRYPNLYQDMNIGEDGSITFNHGRV